MTDAVRQQFNVRFKHSVTHHNYILLQRESNMSIDNPQRPRFISRQIIRIPETLFYEYTFLRDTLFILYKLDIGKSVKITIISSVVSIICSTALLSG